MKINAFARTLFLLLLPSLLSTCTSPLVPEDAGLEPEVQPVKYDPTQYTADSLKLIELYDTLWDYSHSRKYEKLLKTGREIVLLGKKTLAQRYDSVLYEVYAHSYSGIGGGLRSQGYYDEGLEYSKKSFELISAKFGENHVRNTHICVSLALNYIDRGDFDQAIEYLHRSLNIMHIVYPPGYGAFFNGNSNLSRAYTDKKDFEKAVYYGKRLDKLILRSNIPAFLPMSQFNLVRIYLKSRDLESALKHAKIAYSRSLPESEHKKINLLQCNFLFGVIYSQLGEYSKADMHLQACVAGINTLPDSNIVLWGTSVGDILFELGFLANKMKKPALARTYFKNAQTAWKNLFGANSKHITNQFSEKTIFSGIADSHLLEGDFETALQQYQSGLTFLNPSFKPASIYANPQLNELALTEDAFQLLNEKRDAWRQYAEYSGKAEHWQACFETAQLTMQFVNQMRESYKWEGSKQYLSAQATPALQQALEIGLEYQKSMSNVTLIGDFFKLIEQNKAVTLREAVRDKTIHYGGNLPEWAVHYEDSLKQALRFAQEILVEQQRKKNDADSVLVHKLHTKRLLLNESLDSLKQVIKKQYPEYYKLQFQLADHSIEEIKDQALQSNAALVEYFWTDSALYAVFISKQSSQFRFIPLNRYLYKALESVKQLSPATKIQSFTHATRTLYTQLLAPVLPTDQPIDKLIIIPDGPLGNLPFQLLLEKDPDPATLAAENWRELPYLLKSKTIRYEYSAALLLDKQPKHKKGTFYAGFAPAFSGQPLNSRGLDSAVLSRAFPYWRGGDAVPDLKFNRPEVQAVAELIGGTPYLGTTATENNFKQFAPGSSILHLATHACADDQDPLYSQILFAPTPGDSTQDGALHAYELYNMHLNADLAVLSACQTGAGRIQRGEGIMSLSRAFKYAGCPNIVMSLWNANDAASKDIMFGFFKNLKAGLGKAEALSRAQRDYLAKATLAEAHPSRWATFVLFGDDEPVGFESEKWLVALLTLALCTLIVYLFFLRAKT